MPTNREGLTFDEWLDAALAWTAYAPHITEVVAYRKAWEAGEDPTDYASTFERAI